MIKRLWHSLAVKWLFTLLFTGLFGVGLVWFFANQATNTGFDQLKIDQIQADFATVAQNYYESHGSWSDIQQVLGSKQPPSIDHPIGPPPPQLVLADQRNAILLCTMSCEPPYHVGDLLTSDQIAHSTPISVNGSKVGAVLFAQGAPTLDPREQHYLAQINQGLLAGAVGAALIALLVGILLAHHFMRPLNDLTLALRAMRQDNLAQEVPVRSQDELGELTQAFNQMSRALAHANFLRRQMTADIAHDLRTPLTVIGGYLEGMQDGTLKPTSERFQTMNSEVLRLRRLVEDLRTLSLADAGELKLTCQPVPVDTLLNYVATSFQPLFAEKQLHLEVQSATGLPPLNIDRGRMEQALGNLVSNALRHTPTGGTVMLGAQRNQSRLNISVRDTGKGIPPDKLPYIFERLYRVDESRSSGDGESGLGLAIVKSIVEAHGGAVTAQSEVSKGTTIMIQLPNG